MPIYKPGVLNPRKKNIIILLYGAEGAFKTSTALTADNAILHDFNEGGSSRAVNVTEKTRFIPNKGWVEFVACLNDKIFDDYDTHIIDTTSDMLMKYLAPFLWTETPSLKNPTGGLSKDGYAALGARFHEDFMSKFNDKTLIFIAHDSTITEGDDIKHAPNIPGSVGQFLLGNADQIGYAEKTPKGGVVIKFENSNSYRSKDTAKVGNIDIPPADSNEFDNFFQEKVINPLVKAVNMSDKRHALIEKALKEWSPKIDACKDDADVNKLLKDIKDIKDPIQLVQVKDLISQKAKSLTLVYDKNKSMFVKSI